ncbi:MAG: GTP-binding protein [Alphaproteobacteria bacterium]|nr:GTP-binding protein [Alphaproteobacteria bacterium]
MQIPVTVVTGFLGTGKTSAILSAFAHRPEGERWAVIVNEFGEIGIDGAILEGSGVAVKEIPGGCICCTAGVALRFGLVEILRTQKPDRLFIEPTGLADPASIVDLLRQPGIRDHVVPRATIGLVDPRHLADPRYTTHDVWNAQVALCDVLVGGFADVTSPADDAAFEAFAEALWPPKVRVARRSGTIDAEWLDLDPYPRNVEHTHHHDAHENTAGWVYPRLAVFDIEAVTEALQALIRPNPLVPEGLLRVKGIFRVPGRWLLVQGTPTTLQTTPIRWRRDSRVEFISSGEADWDAVGERLKACITAGAGG